LIYINAVAAFIPTIFGPLATFVLFAVSSNSGSLTASKTFSSLAIISLLTTPASEFLQNLPLVAMATSGLQRIQAFLLASPHIDGRLHNTEAGNPLEVPINEGSFELQDLANVASSDAIVVDKLCVRPGANAPVALHDISFRAPKGSLTMIIGMVGSGKSTLLKSLAGELKYESGSVQMSSTRTAYCAQTPWLQNATIRQIICGPVPCDEDETWYQTVIHSCALDEDIAQLPNRDDTIVGTRGVTLSGGQRQRVALARAVYSRLDVIILDDVLSAIDSKTEALIVERLFSKTGIFRKHGSTAFLATHAGE
jgi:ATP-binding cassette subfamily C (CFTR/MRP) protein 1